MKKEETESLSLEGRPLPDEYLVEVGRVTCLWAVLENFLQNCIGKLAGFGNLNEPTAFILLSHSSFPQKLDMLGALCEQRQDKYPEYKSVITKLDAAKTQRNKYMHNFLVINPETGKCEMHINSARKKLKINIPTIELDDIRKVSVTIAEANKALWMLVYPRDIDSFRERLLNMKTGAGDIS